MSSKTGEEKPQAKEPRGPEYHVEKAKAYKSGKSGSLIVVIPKAVRRMLKIQEGTQFDIIVDERGRIVYEPIRTEKGEEAIE